MEFFCLPHVISTLVKAQLNPMRKLALGFKSVESDNILRYLYDLQYHVLVRFILGMFFVNRFHTSKIIHISKTIKQVHSKLRNINLLNVTPSLISQNPKEWLFLIQISHLYTFIPNYCHIFLPLIMSFDIIINYQRIHTTRSHASRCHHCSYCNVNFDSISHILH